MVFKNLLIALVAAGTVSAVEVSSPDGKIKADVAVRGNVLGYSIIADGQPVLPFSALGLAFDDKVVKEPLEIREPASTRTLDESYELIGNQPQHRNLCTESVLYIGAGSSSYSLVVRVYNDGVAVRYLLPENVAAVTGENTSWTLPENAGKVVWAGLSQCYEAYTYHTRASDIPAGKPFLGPVTVEAGRFFLAFSEADNQAFPDMAFVRTGNVFTACSPYQKSWKAKPDVAAEPNVKLAGKYLNSFASPWRYTIVARDLNALVNSDMLTNLCPAPLEDFAWVQPGRCLWQWWNSGEPKFEEQKAWFDAAAALKWEYYLIDDGWRVWKQEGRTEWDLLKEAIDYGKSVGVKAIIWVNSNEMREPVARRKYLEKVKASGAVGIKIDFIPDSTQEITRWYLGGIQDCADLKLLVNYHGAVKPTGQRRTFPHDITREAVRGNEWQMTRYARVMPSAQYTLMPFSRMLAGPADITPTMLDPVQIETGGYTWPNQLAQLVVYLSPITHFCDQYKFYLASPVRDLLEQVPVVWDETRVLPSTEIGETVVYARRKGNTWWLGAINGPNLREITVPLDFLSKEADATLCYDVRKNGGLDRQERKVKPGETLTLTLRASGGFFARFVQ